MLSVFNYLMAELIQAQQLCSDNLWEQLSEFTIGRLVFVLFCF